MFKSNYHKRNSSFNLRWLKNVVTHLLTNLSWYSSLATVLLDVNCKSLKKIIKSSRSEATYFLINKFIIASQVKTQQTKNKRFKRTLQQFQLNLLQLS